MNKAYFFPHISVDAHWNTWGTYGPCSVSCGSEMGTETRQRSCTEAQGSGTTCANLPAGAVEVSTCIADVEECPG